MVCLSLVLFEQNSWNQQMQKHLDDWTHTLWGGHDIWMQKTSTQTIKISVKTFVASILCPSPTSDCRNWWKTKLTFQHQPFTASPIIVDTNSLVPRNCKQMAISKTPKPAIGEYASMQKTGRTGFFSRDAKKWRWILPTVFVRFCLIFLVKMVHHISPT